MTLEIVCWKNLHLVTYWYISILKNLRSAFENVFASTVIVVAPMEMKLFENVVIVVERATP